MKNSAAGQGRQVESVAEGASAPGVEITITGEASAIWRAYAHGFQRDQYREERCQYRHEVWFALPPGANTERTDFHLARAAYRPVSGLRPLTVLQWDRLRLALDGVKDETHDAARLDDFCDPPDDIWDGLLPEWSVAMLAGGWKAGKSTLLRQLIRASHHARLAADALPDDADEFETATAPFLGRAVRPAKWLVVSEERASDWSGMPDGLVRMILWDREPIRKWAEWAEAVRGWDRLCAHYGCDVLVLDTVSRIVGIDENSSAAVTRAMSHLREMGRTVLAVHHTSHAGGIRGSTAWGSQCDSVIRLLPASDDITDRRRRLAVTGRGGVRPQEIGYTMDASGQLILPSPSTGTRADKARAKPAARVRRDIREVCS